MTHDVDLLIVGGGPAGLSAAINGASEGLRVRIMDNGAKLGGQARESSAIENYPGFPEGITGDELMSKFVLQANKFNAGFFCPCNAGKIVCDNGKVVIYTDDYQEHVGKAALLSIGVNYRRLHAEGIGRLLGRGVFYGVPQRARSGKRTVAVVGGANSAGQAVVNLAADPKTDVKMIVRKSLGDAMSQYLIERVSGLGNVEVLEGCEVKAVHGMVQRDGTERLTEVVYRHEDDEVALPVDALYIFIGAVPKTMWLEDQLALDKNKFILTDTDLTAGALAYETSMAHVFAAGDVRSGSTKRIATAIGEGAAALQMVHRILAA